MGASFETATTVLQDNERLQKEKAAAELKLQSLAQQLSLQALPRNPPTTPTAAPAAEQPDRKARAPSFDTCHSS